MYFLGRHAFLGVSLRPQLLVQTHFFFQVAMELPANVAVPARDRRRLERLIRYMARPPLAEERLSVLPDGRIAYVFKRPWRDGTSRVILTPLELIEKLVPLVPRPRAHLTRYHGVLAPAARWRPAVIPLPEREAEPHTDAERHPRNYTWAELMRRVFEFDVLACACGGRLRMLSAIHPPEATQKILECLGLPSRPPPIATASESPLDSFWL